MPKILLLIIISFCSHIAFAQEKNAIHFSIDSIVDRIDSISEGKHKTHIRNKIFEGKKIKEVWKYFENNKFSKISIEYKIDSTIYMERYYQEKGLLIFTYEGIKFLTPSFDPNDYTIWAGDFYFINGKLDYYITLGHGKSELDDWNPEKDNLDRYEKRKTELALLK